jgi:hypothetical protein
VTPSGFHPFALPVASSSSLTLLSLLSRLNAESLDTIEEGAAVVGVADGEDDDSSETGILA